MLIGFLKIPKCSGVYNEAQEFLPSQGFVNASDDAPID
jgi:hypothetical protein